MSLVALKRKTNAKYNNLSVNRSKGFSLNGTTRNQGYIGQTSLSRTLVKTPKGGDASKGHGGCCGTYTNANVKSSEINCLNDNDVVKKSSVGNKAMIRNKYKYIWRPQPYSSVKPDSTFNKSIQAEYIKKKAELAIASSKLTTDGGICSSLPNNPTPNSNYDVYFKTDICKITKEERLFTSIDSSTYTMEKTVTCISDDKFFEPSNTYNTPIP